MHGYRGNYDRRDIINLHLLYEEPDTHDSPVLMSGFIAGITSRGLRPVALPVAAIKSSVRVIDEDLQSMTNAGDSELRACLNLVPLSKSKSMDKIGRVLDSAMVQKNGAIIVHDGNIVSKILKDCRDVESIADSAVEEFRSAFASQKAWSALPPPQSRTRT